MSEPIKKLGQELADELDARDDARELARARAGVLAALDAPRRRRAPVWAFVAAAAVVVLLTVGLATRQRPISFEVLATAGATSGVVGRWHDVPEGGERPLRFSEGSTVLLGPRSRAQVSALRPDGATVVLERGHAAVSVAHQRGTAWSFLAGPFDVRVTGTRFDLDWDAASEIFFIAMQDGSVLVRGPTLGDGAPVVAGQKLRVALRGEPQPPPPPPSASVPLTVKPTPDAPPPASADALPSARRPAGDDATPSWRELATRGEYARAMTAAEGEGVGTILSTGSANDLVLLADAARFSGKPGIARDAYLAVRTRFPGSGQASTAAFSLGRLGGGDALSWFQRYLAEAPNGPLAREAMGRTMELQKAGGQLPAARETARRYLASHPGGPHETLARALLASEPDAGGPAQVPSAPTP